jgi:hypothetical protein
MAWSARAGFPALTVSCVILADALAARWLLRADEERVYVLGRPIAYVCALRARYGLPCPTCGLTRSVVMSLHGEIGRAWRMAPAGPVAVLGLIALALALLGLGLFEWTRASKPAARMQRWIRRGAAIYAVGLLAVWLGGWALSFHAALAAR